MLGRTVLLVVACISLQVAADNSQPPAPKWDHDEHGEDWKMGSCKTGKKQSPINIVRINTAHLPNLGGLRFEYAPQESLKLLNTGVSIEGIVEKGSKLILPDYFQSTGAPLEWPLINFVVHHPSEHKFEGKDLPLELQFVHQVGEGSSEQTAIVGVLFKLGRANPALKVLLDKVPMKREEAEVSLAEPLDLVEGLLPKKREYYHYMGSLTTPDCEEGVRWFVLAEPLTLSRDQLSKVRDALWEASEEDLVWNNRKVQPLNGRQVYHSDGLLPGEQLHEQPKAKLRPKKEADDDDPLRVVETLNWLPVVDVVEDVDDLSRRKRVDPEDHYFDVADTTGR